MSHTPGPWTVEQDNFGDGDGWQTVVQAGKELVAAVWPSTEDDNNHDIPGEGQANARLIAAAPDLLAALGLAETWLMRGAHDPLLAAEAEVLRSIRAAIAKAKGEK